jgi:hypothetical protein
MRWGCGAKHHRCGTAGGRSGVGCGSGRRRAAPSAAPPTGRACAGGGRTMRDSSWAERLGCWRAAWRGCAARRSAAPKRVPAAKRAPERRRQNREGGNLAQCRVCCRSVPGAAPPQAARLARSWRTLQDVSEQHTARCAMFTDGRARSRRVSRRTVARRSEGTERRGGGASARRGRARR